jgi:hypothetical protein
LGTEAKSTLAVKSEPALAQALTCPDHPADRLIRIEGNEGPLLRCAYPWCDHKQEVPLDQRFRAAGLPTLWP